MDLSSKQRMDRFNRELYDLMNDGCDNISAISTYMSFGCSMNYRPKYGRFTTIEVAAKKIAPETLEWIFTNCPDVDYDARQSRLDISPLVSMMERISAHPLRVRPISSSFITRVLGRMRVLVHASFESHSYLWFALRNERPTVVLALIAANAFIGVKGLLAACAWFDDVDSLKALLSAGYHDVRNDPMHGNDATQTALHVALYNRHTPQKASEFARILFPFSKITSLILLGMAQYDMAAELVYVVSRCDVRCLGMTDEYIRYIERGLHTRNATSVIRVIASYLRREQDGMPLKLAVQVSPLVHQRMLIRALVRLGESPIEYIRTACPEALLPWSPKLTREYFSNQFREVAMSALLAMECSHPSCFMPTEMRHTIIVFIGR